MSKSTITLTHPDLPGAVFRPELDNDGTISYYVTHQRTGALAHCETIYDPIGSPDALHFIDAPHTAGGLGAEELDDFVATINAYYAAVTRDRAHNPDTQQKKGA